MGRFDLDFLIRLKLFSLKFKSSRLKELTGNKIQYIIVYKSTF